MLWVLLTVETTCSAWFRNKITISWKYSCLRVTAWVSRIVSLFQFCREPHVSYVSLKLQNMSSKPTETWSRFWLNVPFLFNFANCDRVRPTFFWVCRRHTLLWRHPLGNVKVWVKLKASNRCGGNHQGPHVWTLLRFCNSIVCVPTFGGFLNYFTCVSFVPYLSEWSKIRPHLNQVISFWLALSSFWFFISVYYLFIYLFTHSFVLELVFPAGNWSTRTESIQIIEIWSCFDVNMIVQVWLTFFPLHHPETFDPNQYDKYDVHSTHRGALREFVCSHHLHVQVLALRLPPGLDQPLKHLKET